ncbi:MAG: hypothetical protein ILO34_02275, partial [Kiritimatiellae bacterium]|nr:hypothetical protein [Kiritimatiellia bacterium]
SGIGGAGAPIGGSAGDGADGTGSGGGGGSWGAGAMPGGRGGSGILVLRIGELDGESADPAGYDGRLAETIAGGGVFAGTIQSLGAGASLADVFLEYGLSADNLKFTNYVATVGAEGDFSGTVRGLSTRTVYYGRLFATNDVAGAAACRLSDVFRFETADDAYLDNYNGNDGFWQGVSNGTYNASFAIDDGAGRAFADEMYAVHLNSGWNPNTWNVYGFDAGNVHTCGWSEMVTFGYETMMFMEGGKTYAFAANIDDHAIVVVDGTKIVDTDATGYGAPASSLPKGYFAPQADGWYRVDVYAGNAYQGAGCWDGFIGVGWSDDGGESWNRFLNPAGGPVRFFAPVDDAAEIIRVSREGDSVSAFVQFSKFAAGSGLAAYWASTYPGTATNGWTRVEGIDGTLGASCAGYFSFDIPSGAEYLRFAALKGDYVFQSKALRTCEIDAPDGTGIAAGFVSFGDSGLDSMPVNIAVYSCGEAETADIVVSYGTSPGDLDQSATFGGRGAGIAEIEIGGLVHGTEYFMSFRLENERGERSAQSGTYRYSTLSGASFVPGSMSASDGGTTRFGVSLSGLRDGQTTTVYLYTGDVGSTLTNTCQAVVSPDADGFSADVVFPFLTGSFDYRFVVSNAYHGVVWGESTETATKQIYDSTVYYWRGPDGDWRDPANWTAEGGDGRATYPDSREAVAVIIPDSVSVPVEIALDGTIQAKQIRFMQTGTKAVFSGNGKDSTVLDVAGDDCWNATTENVSMAFRDLCLHSAGFYMWNGCTVSVERAKARLSSETRMIGNNSALIVVGGSELRQTREFIGTLGDNVNIVLDDSAILQDAGGLNLCYENWAGSCRIDICGENPLVRTWGYAVLSGLNSAPAGVVPEIVFHLPAGGYSEPPFMVVSEGYRFLDLSKQRLKISIAEDSPALHMSGKVNTMLLDAKWGIRSDLVDLDNSVEQAVLGYDDPENPTAILVSASCPGFVIIVK